MTAHARRSDALNVAVIGLGWWGRHIVTRLRGNDRLRVVLAVDVQPEPARAFAGAQDLALETDLAAALDRQEVEAVVLTTPHALHEAQVLQAAEAGRHVFCEKPLSLTRASAERMVGACERAGVTLGVGHERRFEPALVALRGVIERDEIGRPVHAEAAFSHDKLADLRPGDWRADPANGPAVPMTGMGVHLTDSWIQLFGPLEQVHALRARHATEVETGDVVSVQARFRSGLTAQMSAITVTAFFMRFHVFGSGGWAVVTDSAHPDDACHRATLAVQPRKGGLQTREFAGVDATVANLEAFARAARGEAPYPVPHEQMVANVAVLEAIARSLDSGRVEAVA